MFLQVNLLNRHSATKVAPAMLMMGFSRLSGIPMMEGSEFEKGRVHKEARENNEISRAKMAENYNRVMKARERVLRIGNKVLVKWVRTRKSMPLWDPECYTVTKVKGSMVTATRANHQVTRNSSFFKVMDDGCHVSMANVPSEGEVAPNGVVVEAPECEDGSVDVPASDAMSVEPVVVGDASVEPADVEKFLVSDEAVTSGHGFEEGGVVGDPSLNVQKRARGRPNKDDQVLIDRATAASRAAKDAANPPVRKSTRNVRLV